MSYELPASIKEASPYNFEITKNDIADPTSKVENPETYVKKIIWEWVCTLTSELLRGKNPEAWEVYPEHFARKIIGQNELFPTTVPIGYVLVCFFRSVEPQIYKLEEIEFLFNEWVMANDGQVREKMRNAWQRAEWYKSDFEISLDQLPNEGQPDGKKQADLLYKQNQKNIFDSEN